MLELYDTTLRDGAQSENISFSVEDKLKILQVLDELGIHYVEGGWPGTNPKVGEFFDRAVSLRLNKACLTAFCSTHHYKNTADQDQGLQALLKVETEVVTIFGKSWDFHVTTALGTTLERNLEIINDTITFLIEKGRRVFYDAEHFFDGYVKNPEYALKTIVTAADAGAEIIVLCDTNGGTMTDRLQEIVSVVKETIKIPFGIHAHNDSGVAVANSLAAVRLGAKQVQGTINGLGERCGNADLITTIPNLKLKYNIDCITDEELKQLTKISRYVSELVNRSHRDDFPFVGHSAFAHKGGIHVSAVKKSPLSYEHIDPDLVGNRQRILISEQAGRSNIAAKLAEYNIATDDESRVLEQVVKEIKEKEHCGYHFEGADGSLRIIIEKARNMHRSFFTLSGFRVIIERGANRENLDTEATIKVVVDGNEEHTAANGDGPVNAMDNALRKALDKFYPNLSDMHLVDYKVRIIDSREGTAAKVRVLIESTDGSENWGTVGVSENIIEASWEALVDAVEYKLLKDLQSGAGR